MTDQDSTEQLTHLDANGHVRMVDVGDKPESRRMARAGGRIVMLATTLLAILEERHAKGDVLATARLAGIMAAKRTSDWIPLCHPLTLTRIDVDLVAEDNGYGLWCEARVETTGRTGVEMEALTAVSAALLTVYDMCKAVDRGMVMRDIRVLEKTGGQSGNWSAV